MVAGILLVTHCLGVQASEAAELRSVEAVCAQYPERVEHLFDALNLDYPGLEAVKAAFEAGDEPAACTALLAYYEGAATAGWLRIEAVAEGEGRVESADAILDGTFSAYRLTARVPRRADGGLDWTYNGPDGDLEWGWGINRQFWVTTLFDTYRLTGNRDYIRGLNRMLSDWIVSSPYPGEKSNTPQWRGLEVFFRIAHVWPAVFFGLQNVPEFTPALRILMLSSVPDHAHYNVSFHASGGNWITMELSGAATAGACWPEFRDADAWFTYAFNRMAPEITAQVYPDGVQKELTSHYHRVALRKFDDFQALAERAGRPLPEAYKKGLEPMYGYLAYAMRPSGFGPMNNDSDLDFTRPEVLAQVERFARPDWTYIATNGAEGTPPEGLPSVVFPWAGQVVMRSGWDADAHWAFFDIGPMGSGHRHFDKLHLSVSAYGRDILVDGGRFTYVGGPWRDYFVGSASHNLVLVDGNGQRPHAYEAEAPVTGQYRLSPEMDLAFGAFDGSFSDVEGQVAHTRAVAYLRGRYWVVVDRIDTDRPRTIQPLWHFHPTCTVAVEDGQAVSTDEGQGNVRIQPASALDWNVEIIKGRETPSIQGWWSREYNLKEPSPCVAYTATIDASISFAWVIVPAKGVVPSVTAAIESETADSVNVRVQVGDAPAETVHVPLSADALAQCP
ncbi:MAG TPA: alginate lyase family protein [Candidatus Hydrogenedentes bacterium]|nr:alginate lyase family protein [Candidatus Hydrogenedentota bacterium]HPG67545.1 alginate lyase family protein [Candidatus Hydrogenedentota bacterium]